MLIRLLPEQVNASWDTLAPIIEQALPPNQDGPVLVKVLAAVLAEKAEVWVYYADDESGRALFVLLTTRYPEPITETQHLLIYTMTGLETVPIEAYKRGLATMRAYAKGKGFRSILAFTNQPAFARKLSQELGARGEFTLIEF